MIVVFEKDKDHKINVFLKEGDQLNEFSYIDMIKSLLKTKKLDEPEISSDFTEAEINSIKSMFQYINKEISSLGHEK